MSPLLLLALLLAQEEPSYPLGPLGPRSLAEPSRLTLTDLQYRATQQGSTDQAFSIRARIANRVIAGAFVDDQRKGASLQTHRLTAGYFEDPSFTNLRAGWRGARLLLDAEAERRPPQDGHGWTIAGDISLRLSADVEAFAGVTTDTDEAASIPRTLESQSLAVLWQRGTRLDLSASTERSRRRTAAGFDLEGTRASASASAYAFSSEAAAELGYERTRGPTARDELFATAAVQTVVARRWLAEAHTENHWEPGVSWFDHELGAGLGLHARRVRRARAGDAASRVLALTRRTYELGYDERRVYDDDGRRALRERLALTRHRAELAPDLRALHAAQIDERRVPLLGISGSERYESVTGVRTRSLEAFVGVPWPPRWPWQAAFDESSVAFLTASYARGESRYGNGFASRSHSAELLAELNREMSLALRWRRPALTPLDVSFIRGHPDAWELEYVYALGR